VEAADGNCNWFQIDRPIIAPRSIDVESGQQVNVREMIGPVNSPLTSQSTCHFKRSLCFSVKSRLADQR
jgi:hypothetical protein